MTTLVLSILNRSSSFLQIRSLNEFVFLQDPITFFFTLAGNNVNYKSLDEFEIQLDQTLDCGVSSLERLKNPHRLIMGEML